MEFRLQVEGVAYTAFRLKAELQTIIRFSSRHCFSASNGLCDPIYKKRKIHVSLKGMI